MNEHEFLFFGGIGGGEITAAMLAEFLRAAGSAPVKLRINSPGGDAFEGIAMHALVRQHGNVTAHIDGLCASAATFVAFGCKRVVMAKEGLLMMHAPHSALSGGAEKLREQAALLDKVSAQVLEIYAARSGKDVAGVTAWLRGEVWMTADEAKAAGLVDEVIDMQVQSIACVWKFRNAPAAIAARLDPTVALRAENERLKSELNLAKESAAAATVNIELAGVEITAEAHASIVKAFVTDPVGARAIIAQLKAAKPASAGPVIVVCDVQQRTATSEKPGDGDVYARHMARVQALRN